MNIFFEIHKDIPREGPGDNTSTKKAFQSLKGLPDQPAILDIGCGPGMQTLELARNTNGKIVALDMHQPFLDRLQQSVNEKKLSHKVEVVKGSMFSLQDYFKEFSFDVIWSEGAIFIMGFEHGLNSWFPFVKKGGFIAVSELTWLKPKRPKEINDFWANDYPGMKTVEENLQLVENAGYDLVDHFTLPESSWWNDYYVPLEKRVAMLREQHKNSDEWQGKLDESLREIEMYRKYSEYYGYVFYVMQKV